MKVINVPGGCGLVRLELKEVSDNGPPVVVTPPLVLPPLLVEVVSCNVICSI